MGYEILLLSENLSPLGERVLENFNADRVTSLDRVPEVLTHKVYRALVVDALAGEGADVAFCEALFQIDRLKQMPVVLLSSGFSLADKVKVLDLGLDDLMGGDISVDEICARINKSVFHRIATEQLSQRLQQATETARSAMVDNSDLGANIQFLLQVHQCDNLDQLGQQFFAIIERYGLSCSLQMRSEMGVKDMEANGMAKDLESQLLTQLRNRGRYVDFGRRTIVNFDRVSLLIRNMPRDDADKYGAIKDNTFCLLQGINARIIALEDQFKLVQEKESLLKLSNDVHNVIGALKHSYQDVMREILQQVENASENIQHRIPQLALSEEDELLMERIADGLVTRTNQTFNEGLKVDELFMRLEKTVERNLRTTYEPSRQHTAANGPGRDNVVELF